MADLNNEDQARLAAYCGLLDINLPSTEENPALALQVLARMYLVPTIDAKADRNKALNEIRGNLRGHFEKSSAFVGQTARVAAQMQEFPLWFMAHHTSTEVLIEQYKSIATGIRILKVIGVGAGSSAAYAAGFTKWLRTGSITAGVKTAGWRLAGRGELAEEVQKKLGKRQRAPVRGGAVSAKGGAIGVVVAVGGTLLYYHGLEKQEEIRGIILHRFNEGKITDSQFREIFGNNSDPTAMKKYWER